MKNSKRSQVLVILLLCLVCSFSRADRVYKKDGAILEGKILLRTPEKLILETGPSLVKIEINIQDVERVEKGGEEGLSESQKALYEAGEKALQEGKPVQALESFLNLLEGLDAPPPFVSLAITTALTRTLSVAESNAERAENRSQAIQQYERLRQISNREGFRRFVEMTPQWQNLKGELNEKLSFVYYLKAVDDGKKNDPSLFNAIEKNLNNALSMTPQTHSRHYRVLESLGLFQMNYNNKLDEAIAIFQKGYEEAKDDTLKQRFYGLLVQARNSRIEKTKGSATAIPSPTPYTAEDIEQLNKPPAGPAASSPQQQKAKKGEPLFKQSSPPLEKSEISRRLSSSLDRSAQNQYPANPGTRGGFHHCLLDHSRCDCPLAHAVGGSYSGKNAPLGEIHRTDWLSYLCVSLHFSFYLQKKNPQRGLSLL